MILWGKNLGVNVGAVEEVGIAILVVAGEALLGRVVRKALGHALGRSAHNVVGEAGRALVGEAELSLDAGIGAVVLGEAAGGALVELGVKSVPFLLESLEVLSGVAADVLVERGLGEDKSEDSEDEERKLHWWL